MLADRGVVGMADQPGLAGLGVGPAAGLVGQVEIAPLLEGREDRAALFGPDLLVGIGGRRAGIGALEDAVDEATVPRRRAGTPRRTRAIQLIGVAAVGVAAHAAHAQARPVVGVVGVHRGLPGSRYRPPGGCIDTSRSE